jgi:hypothetical protein
MQSAGILCDSFHLFGVTLRLEEFFLLLLILFYTLLDPFMPSPCFLSRWAALAVKTSPSKWTHSITAPKMAAVNVTYKCMSLTIALTTGEEK